jgi:predicted nucleotidyltransferase
LVIGFIGEAMEDEDIDNVVIQGEPSPEEIAESDREGIRIAAKEVNYELTPAEIEDIRKAMLKSLILKIVAANSLVPDNVKEDDFETILALYTNVLSNMLKK